MYKLNLAVLIIVMPLLVVSCADAYLLKNSGTAVTVSPDSGFFPGEQTIIITGAGFVSGTTVKIGNNPCFSVNIIDENSLTCLTPSSSVIGTVNISITNPGEAEITVTDAYEYRRFSRIDLAAGVLNGGNGHVDGTGDVAEFDYIEAFGKSEDMLFAADADGNVIRKIDLGIFSLPTLNPADIFVTTLAGQYGVSGNTNSSDGTGATATFNFPEAVVVANGFLYITSSDEIRQTDLLTGETITRVSGLNYATGMVWDGDNTLYMADYGDNKILSINMTSWIVTDFAGDGTLADLDGIGITAQIAGPYGLSIDHSKENLYVSQYNHHKIRKIQIPSATVSTIAGSGVSGSADGIGTAATFSGPNVLNVGNYLFVIDWFACLVRQIDLSNNQVTTILGQANICTDVDGGINLDGVAASGAARITRAWGIMYLPNVGLMIGSGNMRLIH